MARIEGQATVKLEIVLVITEDEARALDALVGYGTDAFLKVFYEHMGQSYLKPHEQGLRSLFDGIKKCVCPYLDRAEKAREFFQGKKQSEV